MQGPRRPRDLRVPRPKDKETEQPTRTSPFSRSKKGDNKIKSGEGKRLHLLVRLRQGYVYARRQKNTLAGDPSVPICPARAYIMTTMSLYMPCPCMCPVCERGSGCLGRLGEDARALERWRCESNEVRLRTVKRRKWKGCFS